MPLIHVLDEPTINQIAAGEVVERPSAVVKELIENAMDAGATAITAEIKEGGLSFIRITDNGQGISKEDIPLAFLRHATSKIRTAEDLLSVTSLGFRGEALSSIAAVAQVELITKTPSALNGFRYVIEGGEEKSFEEIGCPGGTTIIVRNLFYNTPARRKFLKSAMTEAGYISDLMERLMVSHPGVSFKFIVNNQVKLQSSGNNNSKDIIYHVYGRDIARELLSVDFASESFKVTGYLGKPIITRGNRNFENYFINGRYIKSNVITKAIEEAYKPFLMQHKYPFTSLYFEISPTLIDVNVHPQKMEIRLKNGEEIYQQIGQVIRDVLSGKELIPRVSLETQKELDKKQKEEESRQAALPEPFEENRRKQLEEQSAAVSNKVIRTSAYSDRNDNTGLPKDKSFTINYDKDSKVLSADKVEERNTNYPEKNSGNPSNRNNDGSQSSSDRDNTGSHSFPNNYKVSNFNPSYRGNTSNHSPSNSSYANSHNSSHYGDSDLNYVNVSEIFHGNKEKEDEKNNTSFNPIITENLNLDKADIDRANLGSVEESISTSQPQITVEEQMNLFSDQDASSNAPFLSKKALDEHRIIGQVFSTYWLVEYKKDLYIIDQHAAHEKVLYERIMTAAKTKTFTSQQLLPPIVLTLTLREQEVYRKHEEGLRSLGYEIEHFGGNEYSVRAVPADLYGISEKELLTEFIDELTEEDTGSMTSSNSILERVASLSCKAAVKANHTFSKEEASELIKELLTLENPYNCPHGRPVIISMSQYELERKFKRVL